MVQNVPELLLWLFVINHGIAFGAGLYEQRVVVPMWFKRLPDGSLRVDSEAMRAMDVGRRFWAFVTTGPLTLLTLANLVAAWYAPSPRHAWWLAAALVTLVERIGTFSYFIPTAVRLMRADPLAPARSAALASRWLALNHVRALLAVAGWLLALRALSLPA
jgi:Domain of unknown function (DUF1772)